VKINNSVSSWFWKWWLERDEIYGPESV